MSNPPTPTNLSYRVYLLRFWQEEAAALAEARPVWRFSLEDSATHQRRGFESLEALTAFLENEINYLARKETEIAMRIPPS